ncbi:MAG TPA: hypothetical protein VGO53_16530 [Steroidobacteraceae bacterium]|jgi:hypothetical protein|nr:hypothetical protein [Steroidobacteraceae bacterium]
MTDNQHPTLGAMMTLITHPDEADAYLVEHGLDNPIFNVPLVACLLQPEATSDFGRAAVMFVFELPDGRKVLARTTYNLLAMAMAACRGSLQRMGLWEREQQDS